MKISISEKINIIDSKVEPTKAQYNLGRHTVKISALSSESLTICQFLTGKNVLTEKDFPENAAELRRFDYSPLGKELKAQTDIAKKQYEKLDSTSKLAKIIEKEKPTLENYSKSNLIQWNLPIADIPNSGHTMNSWQNRHLSITDKSFKTHRCLLFRGFTVYNNKHNFYKYYRDGIKFNNFSLKTKYFFLVKLFINLNKFKKLKTL